VKAKALPSLRQSQGKPHSKGKHMGSSGWTHVVVVFSMGAQLVVFLRWMHRRMRDDEIQRVFVRDLALRHLPNIYRALNTIAEQQGIELEETPMVNYVDLRNGGRHR
jgi:hypothetical protein